MATQPGPWQPTLHTAFGQLAQDLKKVERLDPDLKIKIIFFKTEFRVRARLAGYSKFLDIFEVENPGGRIRSYYCNFDFEKMLTEAVKRQDAKFKKSGTPLEKLEFWYDFTQICYDHMGHFRF
jgi:hypothetical protein